MTVARWVAFVCTVVALTFTTGCSAILGDFSDTTAGSDGSAGTDSGGGPVFDAGGNVDATPPPSDDSSTGPDTSSSSDDAGQGQDTSIPDAGVDSAPTVADASCRLSDGGACPVTLVVNLAGGGLGAVESVPAGIDCGGTCTSTFGEGTSVSLTAIPSANSTFTGWSGGGCSGTGSCVVDLVDVSTVVTATFIIAPQESLTVSLAGAGTGTVTSIPIGINCTGGASGCSTTFSSGTTVTLSASPGTDSTFTGWTGVTGCAGTGSCTIDITDATNVVATFALGEYAISVTLAGSGAALGTVTSSPAGINCGTACSSQFTEGQNVTLTAVAATGATFTGWTGASGCSTAATCTVSVSTAVNVTASFTLQTYELTVTEAGNGGGTIGSNPSGIACSAGGGVGCQSTFPYGTSVTLTAAPGNGSNFTGWTVGGSGSVCPGTGSCQVTVDAATTVQATFTLQTFALNVSATGTGSATITSSPAGINCADVAGATTGTCSGTYNFGQNVTLSAGTAPGSTFNGWTGAPGCTTAATCVVNVTAVTNVSAEYTINSYTVGVASGAAKGTGTVSSNPSGFACNFAAGSASGTCSEVYTYGTSVTLTASPGTGSSFVGWAGGPAACTTNPTCVIDVTAAESITASFALIPETLTITAVSGSNGAGTITTDVGGINCAINGGSVSGTCSASIPYGSTVNVTPAASTGSTFTAWGGACSGTGACSLTMTAAAGVSAGFTLIPETLTIKNVGPGVVSYTGGTCSAPSCTVKFNYGTNVTLTTTPYASTSFVSWSSTASTCTGTSCSISMTGANTATATWAVNQLDQLAMWDPSWGGAGLIYSNANLSVTSPTGAGAYGTAARSNIAMTSGAWYWEVTITAGVAGNDNGGIGIAGTGYPNSGDYLGEIASSLGLGYGGATDYYNCWTSPCSITAGPSNDAIVTGEIYMFALNVSSGDLWVGANGTWYTGNPSTNTAPTFTGITGPVFPAVTFYEESTEAPNAFTANFGGSAFNFPVPTGFNAGVYATKIVGYPTLTGCTGGTLQPNFLFGESITTTTAMTLTGLGVGMTAASGSATFALYDNSGTGGVPGKLIVASPYLPTVAGENIFTVPSTALAVGTYWLVGDYSSEATICISTTTMSDEYISLTAGTAPPAAFGTATADPYYEYESYLVGY